MQSTIKKRKTIAEYAANYDMVPKHVALQILLDVDVQDAMNFLVAAGGSPKYRYFYELMDTDEIWKLWMRRDLAIIFDRFKDMDYLVWENVVDGPKWKVFYLWYRLFISAYQYNIIEMMNEGIRESTTDLNTGTPYPPNCVLTFIRLNEIKITCGDEGFMRDFRTEFTRMAPWILSKKIDIYIYSLRTLSSSQRAYFPEYFFKDHLHLDDRITESYVRLWKVFDNHVSKNYHYDNDRIFNAYIDDRDKKTLSKFPREMLPGKIYVTTCVTCGNEFSY